MSHNREGGRKTGSPKTSAPRSTGWGWNAARYRGLPLGVGANGSPGPSLMGASREAGWGASRQRGKVSVRPETWRPAMAAMRRDRGEIVNLPPCNRMPRKCHVVAMPATVSYLSACFV